MTIEEEEGGGCSLSTPIPLVHPRLNTGRAPLHNTPHSHTHTHTKATQSQKKLRPTQRTGTAAFAFFPNDPNDFTTWLVLTATLLACWLLRERGSTPLPSNHMRDRERESLLLPFCSRSLALAYPAAGSSVLSHLRQKESDHQSQTELLSKYFTPLLAERKRARERDGDTHG